MNQETIDREPQTLAGIVARITRLCIDNPAYPLAITAMLDNLEANIDHLDADDYDPVCILSGENFLRLQDVYGTVSLMKRQQTIHTVGLFNIIERELAAVLQFD